MKIQTWLKQAREQLQQAGIDSSALDARLIMQDVLDKSSEWIIAHDDDDLKTTMIERLNKKLHQRIDRIPLAYIVGSKQFYGRSFTVNNNVLIPRPESETVISSLLELVAREDAYTILDVGTGSGCLAISAQLELPHCTVIATDISTEALEVAHENAKSLEAPVQFFNADLLNVPASVRPDIILANLPYVPDGLITSEEITNEPSLALFSGDDGMDHYRTMWGQLVNFRPKPHYILTESLASQHAAQKELAKTASYSLLKTTDLIQIFERSD